MNMMFNYNGGSELMNDIVDSVVEATVMRMNKQTSGAEYKKLQETINKGMARYCLEGTKYYDQYEEKGAGVFKNPRINKNSAVRENFNAVIAEIINVVIPTTSSRVFGEEFIDVHQTGWGDTARFLISSNELFKVNKVAEGVHRATLQPIYNNEITVNCEPVEIATSIDWYAVAAGVFDWGEFGFRAGKSFDGYIMLEAIQAMARAAQDLGDAYSVATTPNDDQWATLAQRVSAANGGAGVYALGTLNALHKVIPNTVGLQYGLGQEVAKEGFLSKFMGVNLIAIDQFIVPGTVNSTAALGVPSDKIYMVAAEQYRPIKLVFEGDSVEVTAKAEETTDKTYRVSIQMRIGVEPIIGSKFGVMTVNA